MSFTQKADRDEKAQTCASKMANALAEAWKKGERVLVKRTIEGAVSPSMSKEWQASVAAVLEDRQREDFTRYMRGAA